MGSFEEIFHSMESTQKGNLLLVHMQKAEELIGAPEQSPRNMES